MAFNKDKWEKKYSDGLAIVRKGADSASTSAADTSSKGTFDKAAWEKKYADGLAIVRSTKTAGSTATSNKKTTNNAGISDEIWANNPAYAYLKASGAKTGGITKGSDAIVKGTANSIKSPVQIAALGAGDYGASNSTRFDKVLNAAVSGSAGAYKKLAADITSPTGNLSMGESARAAISGVSQQEAEAEKRERANNGWVGKLKQNLLTGADESSARAYAYEQEAKEGLGRFGQGVVDFGIAGLQFAGDAALNALAPGAGLTAMAGRAYGSASQQAKEMGLSEGEQQISGLKSAAIEVLTEKLFGSVSKVAYGKGIVRNENLVNSLVNRLAKTDRGRTALKVLVGANEEGLEEVLSDVLNPIADRVLKLDDGKGDWSDLADDFDTQQMLEDYIIGAALGLAGAGANVMSGQYKAENAQQRAYEEYQRQLVNAGLATEQGGDAQLTAEEYKNILDQSTQRGKRNLSDKETKNLETLIRGTYAQEDASDVSSRLVQLGTDANEQTVNAIVKAVNGETLSRAEQKAFNANPYSQRVVNEMTDTRGVTSNEWYTDRAQGQSYTPEKSSGISIERAQNVLNTSSANYPQFVNSMARQYEVAPEVIERTYNLNPTTPQAAFSTAFNAVYQMGQQGTNKAALSKVPVLNMAQANIAYQMGADNVNNTQEVNSSEIRVRNGAERLGGQNTGGQVRAVAEDAGRNVTGAGGSGQGGYSAIQGKAGERVVYNGAEQKNAYYYAGEETEDMKKGRKLAESYGYKVAYFVGDNIRVQGGTVRGVVDTESKTVMVRADHPDLTPLQIMRHEMGHAAIARGDFTLAGLRERLLKDFTDAEIDEMMAVYSNAYGGILSPDEAFEEICCDALGKINIFAGTKQNSASYVKAQRDIRKYAADRSSTQGRAPPEGGVKYSLEGKNKDGIEVYTTSEEVRSLTRKERQKKFLEIMQNEYRGRTAKFIRNGHAYYATFDENDIRKNIYGDKRSSGKGYNAKLKVGADGNIFELVENSKYNGSKAEQGKNIQAHKQVRYWDYFIKTVQIDNEVFDLLANVRRKSDGDYVYSIQLRANKSIEASAAQQPDQTVGINKAANASVDSIRSSEENVKRFSMEAPVEQKENLIALHNLDETKLLKTLKLGGFPMPSIAITKSNIPHTNFGNITIVFGKETIDPKFDKRNTVYSADAWTPTFPQIEYEASPKTEKKIKDIYYPLSSKYGYDFTRPLYESANYLGDTLTRYGGEKGLIEKFSDDVDMMNVFLAASGKEPIKAADKEIVTRLPDTEVEMYEYLANAIGEKTVNDMQTRGGENPISARRRWVSEHEQDIISAWQGYLTDVVGMSREAAEAETSEMEAKSLTQTFVKTRNYLKNGAETRRTEPDTAAQHKAIRAAVNKTEYKAWLESLYSGAVKNSGVYNNKDVYTSSGNMRSFKALHFPATLDGIVSAMASQNKGSTKNVSGFHGVKTLRAGTAERFGSIEDMHKLEGRLSHLTEAEADEIHNALSERLSTQMNEIYSLIPHSGNDYIGLDALGEIYMEAAELKYKSPANVKALFKKYRYNLSDKQANDVVALLFDINNMPVNIFEAKPERAVSFDEIRKVIIPDTSSDELRTALKNAGIENVEEYAAGDDAARMRIANSVPNVHFSREQSPRKGEDKYFARQIDQWDGKDHGGAFRVGGVSEPLLKVGIPNTDIWFDQSKAAKQLLEKGEITKAVIKQIPEILQHPIAISESYDNTVMVFGQVFDANGNPIVVALRVNSTKRRNSITLVNKIRSIGSRSHNLDKLLSDSNILYLAENKKETKAWFNALGRSTPFGGTKLGLIRSVSFSDAAVKASREPETLNELRRQNERKLAQATAEDAANENERGLIRDYQKQYNKVEDIREKLTAAQQTLTESEDSGADYDTTIKAKNRFTVLSNQYAREHRKLESYANMKALQNVLTRVDERLGNDLPEGMGAASANFTGEETVGERWVTEAQGKGDSALHPISKEQEANLAEQQQRAPQEIPKKDLNGKLTSKHVSTIANSGMTPAEFSDALREDAAQGKFSHIAYSDEAALKKAERAISAGGWDQALANYKAEVNSGKVSKDNTVMGIALYNNAVNSGDYATAMDIASLMVKNSTNTAQSLQAMRILNKLSPECRLYLAAKSIENIEEDLNERYKDNKADIHVDKILYDEYAKALRQGDEDGIKTAWANIEQSVAQQIDATWYEKLNNFRYLAMLGNPRTHVRNIVGNAFFVPVRAVKNTIAYGLENIADTKTNGGIERSKAILNPNNAADAALVKYAMSDFEAVQEVILSGGKFVDTFQGIGKHRTIYKTKILEAARKGNSAALDAEDAWFCKPAYANALAKWYKANGISAEQLNTGKVSEETIIKAQTIAIKEAQKATYRDTNWFSAQVSRLGKVDNKIASVLIEGVLPFKKTPANILARAVEYSPVGLIKSLALDTKKVKAYVNGDIENGMSPAQFIDDVSAGLTGSALMGLGVLLASWGVLSGGEGDDEKQNYFDDLSGKQNYALSIGGLSITLDWLAPESMPLFVGVELFNSMSSKNEDKGFWQNLISSVMSLSTPMFEMSMLQSVNDLFDNLAYIKQGQGTFKIVSSMAANYISQYFPTLFGQTERSFEETQRETTYIDRNSKIGTELQYMWGKIANKIPFYDFSQIPYIDAWGRTEETGNLFERMLNNFVNPAYVKKERPTEIDGELERLYDLGETSVYPSRAKTNTKINGEYLTADEYVKYATTKGQTSYELAQGVINSAAYSGASDSEKAYMLKYVYSYADHIAKYEVNNDYSLSKWEMAAYKSGNPMQAIIDHAREYYNPDKEN